MTEEKEKVLVAKNRHERKRLAKALRMPIESFPPLANPWTKEHRIGRNEPCPCGEGRSVEDAFGIIQNIPYKYKNCHMISGKYENYKTN